MSDAWDTDLGRWALAWMRYGRGEVVVESPPVADPAEACDDERDADAAVQALAIPVQPVGVDGTA